MSLKMHRETRWNDIEELTEIAGTATEPPPPPENGIPRQWLPGLIRWPIRVLVLPFVLLDLAAQSLARKIVPPPFRQEGHCLKRGNCCYYVLIPEPKGILPRIFYFWHTQVNGFFLRRSEPIESEGKKMVVMGCRYLKRDGSCGHYRLRPTLCREWPMIRHFGYPRILKGCGFRAQDWNSH